MDDEVYSDGAITKKNKELMGLAISVVTRCNGVVVSLAAYERLINMDLELGDKCKVIYYHVLSPKIKPTEKLVLI